MHFLMPMVFSSHSDFKEWFSNPLSGMVEGSQEYNDSIVKRLHQVFFPQVLSSPVLKLAVQLNQFHFCIGSATIPLAQTENGS